MTSTGQSARAALSREEVWRGPVKGSKPCPPMPVYKGPKRPAPKPSGKK